MDIERKIKGKKFYYVKNNKIIKDEKTLERIKKISYTTKWNNVQIANYSDEKIQCTGYDAKGRKQYKYNIEFIKEQTNIKYFDTLIKFGKKINIIRNDIERILRKKNLGLRKNYCICYFYY